MSFWTKHQVDDGKCYVSRIGSLTLWFLKKDNELLIAEQQLPKENEGNFEQILETPHEAELPENVAWKRWIVNQADKSVGLVPVMPTRPIVVRPEAPVQVLPGNKTCFFVSIPVSVRITSSNDDILTEVPIRILSNIWFGDPMSGELCFSVKSGAVTSIEQKKEKVYTATCPICIENQSSSLFNFNRFAVHTEYFSVYLGQKHLWTNQIDVVIEGGGQKSSINIPETPPQIEEITKQLSPGREKFSKKFYKKMFSDFSFLKG